METITNDKPVTLQIIRTQIFATGLAKKTGV